MEAQPSLTASCVRVRPGGASDHSGSGLVARETWVPPGAPLRAGAGL